MEQAELIMNMQSRVDQCRRLASFTTDQRAREALAAMANEIEEDIRRLVAEGAGD